MPESKDVRRPHRILVVGATGYVGQELVRQSCQEGLKTYAHVRESERAERHCLRLSEFGAQPIVSTWEKEAISKVLRDLRPTVIFSLLGTTKSSAKSEEIEGDIYDRIDYGLTSILIGESSVLPEKPRVVYLSSIGASQRSRSAYLRARGKIEEELAASGLSYVSAQPSIITGRDRETDRPMERFSAGAIDAALRLTRMLGAKRLREKYRSTNAQTLAAALLRLGLSGNEGIAGGEDLR